MKTYKEFLNQVSYIIENEEKSFGSLGKILQKIKTSKDPKLKELYEKLYQALREKIYADKNVDGEIRDLVNAIKRKEEEIKTPIGNFNKKELRNTKTISNDDFKIIRRR